MSKIEFKKVKLENGETMAYRHVGSGENKLVLIHGFQSSSQFFEDLLESLDENIEVFAPDLIGYGESSYENKHKDISDWSKDLYYFQKKLDLNNFTLAGWSLGGLVCMDFAALYPKLVKNLILIASVPNKGLNIKDTIYLNSKELKSNFSNSILDFKLNEDKKFIFTLLDKIKNRDMDFLKTLLNQSIFNVSDPDPDDLKKMVEDLIKQECFLESIFAMIKYDNTKTGSSLIENISMPVTWFHGDKDMVVPIEYAYDSLKYFPNRVNFQRFNKSGHAIFVDEKEKFIEIFEELIKNEK